MRTQRTLIAVTVTAVLFPPLLGPYTRADDAGNRDKVPRIAAEEAGKHVDETVIVEMRVKSSRYLEGPGICLLNSCKNYRDAKNFTVVLMERGLTALKGEKPYPSHAGSPPPSGKAAARSNSETSAAKIDKPARHYRGKKIRVTGRIELYQSRPQITVERAEQIAIVKPKKKERAVEKKEAAPSVNGGTPSR